MSFNEPSRLHFPFGFGGNILLCPKCRDFNTHVMRCYAQVPTGVGAEQDAKYGLLYGVPVHGTGSGRRGSLCIEVWCEQWHWFRLVFRQHKGTTFIDSEEMPDGDMES